MSGLSLCKIFVTVVFLVHISFDNGDVSSFGKVSTTLLEIKLLPEARRRLENFSHRPLPPPMSRGRVRGRASCSQRK